MLVSCSATKSYWHGMYVIHEGSHFEAEGCTLQKNARFAAFALEEAVFVLRGCDISENYKGVIYLQQWTVDEVRY